MSRPFWHYTCDDKVAAVQRAGVVVPGAPDSDGPGRYGWFTDLAHPVRAALGLTSQVLTCDRTRHRFRVTDPDALTHWIRVRRSHPWALDLETAPGARLMHWWVATVPVPVTYDPVTTGPRP